MTRRGLIGRGIAVLCSFPVVRLFGHEEPKTIKEKRRHHIAIDTDDICARDINVNKDEWFINATEQINAIIKGLFETAKRDGVVVDGLTINYRNILHSQTNPDGTVCFFRVYGTGEYKA